VTAPVVAVPGFTKTVRATVRCAQFSGTVQHGGNGSPADPGFIIVKGTLNASCPGTVGWAQVGWINGLEHHGPLVLGKKIRGKDELKDIVFDQHDRLNTYAHIFVQACTTVRGKAVCGPHVTV
jgi:hypothetical protein